MTDHELIQDFQEGNLHALETLILRHKDKLYTSILFLVKDKYLAEDIFQDVLIKVIDTIRGGRYTEEGKFLPWAIEQKVITRTPRSTVGSMTEIYDYLRLLYARIGKTISPVSGREVKKDDVNDVVQAISKLDHGDRAFILIPFRQHRNRHWRPMQAASADETRAWGRSPIPSTLRTAGRLRARHRPAP